MTDGEHNRREPAEDEADHPERRAPLLELGVGGGGRERALASSGDSLDRLEDHLARELLRRAGQRVEAAEHRVEEVKGLIIGDRDGVVVVEAGLGILEQPEDVLPAQIDLRAGEAGPRSGERRRSPRAVRPGGAKGSWRGAG